MEYDEMDPAERRRVHDNAVRVARPAASRDDAPVIYADPDGARRDKETILAAWAQAAENGEAAGVTMGKVHEAAERLYLDQMVAAYKRNQADPTTRTALGIVIVDGYCYLEQAVSMGTPVWGWHQPYVYTGETDPMDE